MTRFTKAARAFEAFTGDKARRVTSAQLADENVSGWRMGPVVGIAYEAKRDGQTDRYFHEFSKTARPDLVSADDGKQLFITGGSYTVTERGIEDVPELFVVNPSPRRAAARKGKTTMARAARNSKGRFVKRSRAKTYKANPAPPRRKRRAAPKARRTTRQVAVFRANPAPRKRRYKRNPIGGTSFKGLGKMLMPAMGVGAGAVGSEIVMGYLPIPANFKQGVLRHITKGAVGVGAGLLLSKVLKQKTLGFYVAAGAVVIATHDAIKEFIAARLPMIPQGGFGQYVTPLPSQFGGMGYINPGATARFGQYVAPLPSQFGGMSQAYDAPGGETDFRA